MTRQAKPKPECARAARVPRALVPPRLTVEFRSIHSLIPDPANPRLHTEKQIGQLIKSITAFGFCVPLLLDQQGHVIAGHGRLLAVKRLGWTELPTITLGHLSPDQVRALRVADNRLAESSTWDERLLADQLRLLAEADLDFDLEAIGFDLPEIDLRVQSLSELEEEPDVETADAGQALPIVSVLGDLWQLGPHRIICGDALQLDTYHTLLGTQKAAMVFTDTPYNVHIPGHAGGKGRIRHEEFAMASGEMSRAEFTDFLTQALRLAKDACISGALIYACIDWRHLIELSQAGEAHQFELKNVAVWDKGCGGMGSLYRSQHELVFVFKSGTASHTNNVQLGKFGRNRTNVWQFPGSNSFARATGEGNLLEMHPTAKPVALVAEAMLDASERGDVVLDPFLGSGTCVIAAEKTGRIGYGIELDPRYVDTAVRRWQRLTGQAARHGVTQQLFDEVACDRAVALPRADESIDSLIAGEGA
jgi:DNA modification methylase